MTQHQLALHVGLSRTSITNIEAGRQGDIGVSVLMKLAEALGCSLPDLTGSTETPPWLELARRVTDSQRRYERLAAECWQSFDVLAAVRWRGVAEGLEMARNHHLAVVAEAGDGRRG